MMINVPRQQWKIVKKKDISDFSSMKSFNRKAHKELYPKVAKRLNTRNSLCVLCKNFAHFAVKKK